MRCSRVLSKLVYTLYASRPLSHSMPYTFDEQGFPDQFAVNEFWAKTTMDLRGGMIPNWIYSSIVFD